jgi:hypothetical protein
MGTIFLRTVWLGLLPIGLASCTIQMPRVETAAKPETNPAPKEEPPPPRLGYYISTGDPADRVLVYSKDNIRGSQMVTICLEIEEVTWWKGLGIGRPEPTLQVERGQGLYRCTDVEPGWVDITFWKAKMFGIHTRLATARLDLRRYGRHTVTFQWVAD